jgi:hypothetical protein
MKDQFLTLTASISEALTGFGIHMEYNETSAEENEFYDVLMLCYELLIRTQLVSAVEVLVPAEYIEPGDDLKPGDMIPAYNITLDALADFSFAMTTKKGKVDLRALLKQRIYQQGNMVMVKDVTGFHKSNLSDYFKGKREMQSGTWEMIVNTLNEYSQKNQQ